MPDLGPGGRGGARRRTRRRQQAIHGSAQASQAETVSQQPAAPATPAPAAGTSVPEYLGELEKLGKLRDKGLITEDEFAAKKSQLLGL